MTTDPQTTTPDTQPDVPKVPDTDAESGAELPDVPEDYTLRDGSTVAAVTDAVHYGYAENPRDQPRTVVPFAVQVTEPSGKVTELECETEDQSHFVHGLVVMLDRLGYVRS